jgi:hypothetical protein
MRRLGIAGDFMVVVEEVSMVGAAGADGVEVVAIVEAVVPSEDQFGGIFPSEWIMAFWYSCHEIPCSTHCSAAF